MAATLVVTASADAHNSIEIVMDFDGNANYQNKSMVISNPTLTYDNATQTCYVKSAGIDQLTFDNNKAVALGISDAANLYMALNSRISRRVIIRSLKVVS